MPDRLLTVNRTEDDRVAVATYWFNGTKMRRLSATRFSGWGAALTAIHRATASWDIFGHSYRVEVRSDLAVNTPDGLVF